MSQRIAIDVDVLSREDVVAAIEDYLSDHELEVKGEAIGDYIDRQTTITEDISDVQDDVSKLDERVTALEEKEESPGGDYEIIRALSARVGKLDGEVRALSEELRTSTNRVESLELRLNKLVEGLFSAVK